MVFEPHDGSKIRGYLETKQIKTSTTGRELRKTEAEQTYQRGEKKRRIARGR
jgi:hypothetical protein